MPAASSLSFVCSSLYPERWLIPHLPEEKTESQKASVTPLVLIIMSKAGGCHFQNPGVSSFYPNGCKAPCTCGSGHRI